MTTRPSRIGVLLGLRPAELRPVLVLAGWCFGLVGAVWLTRSVRDSLFLSNVGAAALPPLYIASPLSVSAVGFVYARYADRFRRERLIVVTSVAVAAALAAVHFALGTGQAVYYGLYIGTDVATSLIAMQFWTIAGDQFTARDAKRLIGLIAAGGTVANIVIGFGVKSVVKQAGAENLLFVCSGLVLLTAGLAIVLTRMYGGRLGRGKPRARGARDTRGLGAPGAGHLRLVAMIGVCGVITLTFLDFQFKSITAAAFNGDRVAMVGFFGMISGVTGCVSLAIQLGVTSRLLARVGVAGVLLFLPVLLALGSTALVIVPGLIVATFCKASEGTLRYTLQDAGMQLVYVPVPSQVRSRVKATIDTVIRPGTEATVGLALLGARAARLPLTVVAAAAAVAASVWVFSVVRLRKAYVRSLRETLRRRKIDLDVRELREAGGAVEAPPPEDTASMALLVDAAAPVARRRAAARALGHAATADAESALVAALAEPLESLRGAVCQALVRAHRLNPALAVPRDELDAAVRRELEAAYLALAAAEGLGRAETAMNPDGTRDAPAFILDEPEGASALASKALRERWERARDRILSLLEVLHPDERLGDVARSLVDPEAVRRANAVEVLDSILPRELRRVFIPLVDESPRYLKLTAVEGHVEIPARSRDAWVEALLADPSPWMVACAAYYAGQHRIGALAETLARLRRSPAPVVAETAAVAVTRLSSDSVEPTTMTTVEKVLFLKGIDLFSALAGEDLAEIARIAEEVGRDQGEAILTEGEHGDALYFIIDGRVAVQKGGKTLAELGQRDVLGEMALLDPGPRSASAVALSDVTLLSIGREDFDDIMRDRPEVPIGVMKVLVRRMRATM